MIPIDRLLSSVTLQWIAGLDFLCPSISSPIFHGKRYMAGRKSYAARRLERDLMILMAVKDLEEDMHLVREKRQAR
jgi:hypothetical protein